MHIEVSIRNSQRSVMLATFLLLAMAAWAIPAKPGLSRLLTLTDGTTVSATLVGDEHGHFWRGDDGKDYQMVAGSGTYQEVSGQDIVQKAHQRRALANQSRTMRLAPHKVGDVGSITGDKKGIIILVNFQDVAFTATQDDFSKLANQENYSSGSYKGSMYDYFYAQSEGQFRLTFDVVGPYTVSKNCSYYGENDSEGNDKRPAEMVIEAIKMADADVNFADYDWDGDGTVEQVYVVYAGKGEADGGSDDTIWPHEYDLYSANYYGDGAGRQKLDGVWVNTYACGGELNGSTGATAGIGTMCHEFSHCLGYPDFYDTDYSGGQGMGYWDLMDSGSYNDDGYQPAGYTSYERWVAGWKTPVELVNTQTVSNMKALQTSGSNAYIIYNKGNTNEYYLLENRQKTGWDASLPGAGLLILHVDYNSTAWANNTPNDDPSHQRMTWIPADNQYQYTTYQGTKYYTEAGAKNDPFPYASVNAFGKNTTPAATLYNKNSDNTYYLDSSVENIAQNSDGTITFNFVDGSTITPDTPDDVSYETIDFTKQGFSNGEAIESVSGTSCTVAFDKGTNSNKPTYYDTGTAIRVYAGGSMTVSSSTKTIVKIELTFGSSDGSNAITTDVATYSNGTWTGNAQSVTFTVGGTSGHRRVKTVTVTYGGDSGGSDDPDPTPDSDSDYYKNADGKMGSQLKTAMCGIIYNRTEQSYNDLWTAFQTTDKRSDGKVWDVYSDATNFTFGTDQAGNYSSEGDKYNREHSWPQSWFGSNTPMYTDLHHIYPTDGFVNGKRANYPFGETSNPTYTSTNGFSKLGPCSYDGYTGTVFEPADEYKGDFARTYFYMVTCYEEKLHDWYTNYSSTDVVHVIDGSTYPALQTWQLEMLMEWAKDDPVSEKEVNRNNAVYAIQNNRNPFIDYPGLEEYIWGTMTTTAFSYDNYVQPVYSDEPDDPVPSVGEVLLYEGLSKYDNSLNENNSISKDNKFLDYKGWDNLTKVFPVATTANVVYANGGSFKLGSSSAAGCMTSGSIALVGSATLTFYLMKYGSDTGKLKVTVTGATTDVTEFTPSSNWTLCTVNITNAEGAVTIALATSSQRAYVDEITLKSNKLTLSDDETANSTAINAAANSGGKYDVTLSGRTLYKDGEWNTLCLPFDVTLAGSPLEGAVAKTLTDATMDGTHVTLTFGDAVTTLQAGMPYIIKWDGGSNIVNPVFTGVTVVSGFATDITRADGNVKFIGYYDAFVINPTDNADIYYMTAGNTLKHTGKERTLKACRAYFQFSEAAAARQFVLNFGAGETTSISLTPASSPNDERSGYYTVDGRKLVMQPTRRGLYIHNGNKVVIK